MARDLAETSKEEDVVDLVHKMRPDQLAEEVLRLRQWFARIEHHGEGLAKGWARSALAGAKPGRFSRGA